jgi:hypothetical protein
MYQHLVPQMQNSAMRKVYGTPRASRGADDTPRPVLGERCVLDRPDLPGLDLLTLEQDECFAVGDLMLRVKAGTTVVVESRRRARASSINGLYPDFL